MFGQCKMHIHIAHFTLFQFLQMPILSRG
uniref:Uncharacterized protein n=1 Tax=Anguilla anguilla TaxID=7936 RepID=A0A0E9TWT3_ANGAN